MMTPREIGRQFNRLAFRALEDPTGVDRSALLATADAFLNAAEAGHPTGLELARQLAQRACDWAVFGTPESYQAFARAHRIFGMYVQINPAIDRMAN